MYLLAIPVITSAVNADIAEIRRSPGVCGSIITKSSSTAVRSGVDVSARVLSLAYLGSTAGGAAAARALSRAYFGSTAGGACEPGLSIGHYNNTISFL